jgi:hypothetical protein
MGLETQEKGPRYQENEQTRVEDEILGQPNRHKRRYAILGAGLGLSLLAAQITARLPNSFCGRASDVPRPRPKGEKILFI